MSQSQQCQQWAAQLATLQAQTAGLQKAVDDDTLIVKADQIQLQRDTFTLASDTQLLNANLAAIDALKQQMIAAGCGFSAGS